MGVAPVITDGALVLAESGAICDYINVRYGQGRLAPAPSDPDFPEHLFWFHWTNGTYGSAGFAAVALALVGKSPSDVPLVKDRLERCRAMIEQRLGVAPLRRPQPQLGRHHDGVVAHDRADVPRRPHRRPAEHPKLPRAHRAAPGVSTGDGEGGAGHGADVDVKEGRRNASAPPCPRSDGQGGANASSIGGGDAKASSSRPPGVLTRGHAHNFLNRRLRWL